MKPIVGDEYAYPGDGSGMTLRDYFAAKAMVALCEKPRWSDDKHIAMEAYQMADAMLDARLYQFPPRVDGFHHENSD